MSIKKHDDYTFLIEDVKCITEKGYKYDQLNMLGFLSYKSLYYTEYRKCHNNFFYVSANEITRAVGISKNTVTLYALKFLKDDIIDYHSGTTHQPSSYRLHWRSELDVHNEEAEDTSDIPNLGTSIKNKESKIKKKGQRTKNKESKKKNEGQRIEDGKPSLKVTQKEGGSFYQGIEDVINDEESTDTKTDNHQVNNDSFSEEYSKFLQWSSEFTKHSRCISPRRDLMILYREFLAHFDELKDKTLKAELIEVALNEIPYTVSYEGVKSEIEDYINRKYPVDELKEVLREDREKNW